MSAKANSILGTACRQGRHTATDRTHGCPMVELLGQSFHVYSFLSLINPCHSALLFRWHLASLEYWDKAGRNLQIILQVTAHLNTS